MSANYVCTVISRPATLATFRVGLDDVLSRFSFTTLSTKKLADHVEDVHVSGDATPDFRIALNNVSEANSVDIVLQPDNQHRRKKLVVFDMDSTLIQNECIDLIAAHAGVEKEVAAITEAAMRGELDFAQSLDQRVKLLKGIPSTVYDDLKVKITVTHGAEKLVNTLKKHDIKTAVVSGGFMPLAQWLKERLCLDYAFANTLQEDDDHKLTGRTIGWVVDGQLKATLLQEIAHKEHIAREDTMAVGDGSNDLPMMEKAGLGVAFCAKPIVQKKAPSRLNTGNLEDILYILGISP